MTTPEPPIYLQALWSSLQIPSFTEYEDAYPLSNPFDVFRCSFTDSLAKVSGVDPKMIFGALSWPNALEKGDLILAVPRLRLKGPGATKAAEWCKAMVTNPAIKQPEPVGISMRFDYNPEILPSLVLPYVYAHGSEFGMNKSIGLRDPTKHEGGRQRVIVEFSSPNIAKEFHVGHLRSTIIGAFLANLYEALGWDVVRMNYLGDWGRQFGLLAVGWHRYGNEEAFERDPIAHLFETYVKINADFKPEDEAYKAAKKRGEDTAEREKTGLLGEAKNYFKRMEEGDSDALALWNRFRNISIDKYKATYARLNIEFSDYSGESQVRRETMEAVEKILVDKGIADYNAGATIVDFKKFGAPKLEVAIIRNRYGASTYLLRDIGAAIQRWQTYDIDHMIYVIMDEQVMHVRQFFKILELMGDPYSAWSKNMQLATFGKIRGMSTRRGTVKFLGDVLNDVGDAMHDVMRRNQAKYDQVEDPNKVADTLGISSIMIQDMSGKRINVYEFQLERMTSFEGDTGPYLQYAHARLCSIARKTGYTRHQLSQANFALLKESHAVNLVRIMGAYPDTVLHTYKTLEPATIVTYLFRLAHQVSSSYDVLQIVGAIEGPDVALARASLYEAARQVLWNGMTLIGLSPVSRM